jgi:glycosyltransferase involved in cell wall biosynthesis
LKSKNINIQYNLIGDGTESTKLIELCKELSIDSNVIFHGRLENFNHIIYESDISIIPSRQEAFGLSLVESMLSSIPVISSGKGGLQEIADENYVNTFISVNDLGEKILEMSNNKILTKNKALKAREYSIGKFDINIFLDNFENIFKTRFIDCN